MPKLVKRADFWFWTAALSILAFIVRCKPSHSFNDEWTFEVSNGKLPFAIVLFSLFFSAIYAYCFLLLPVTAKADLIFGDMSVSHSYKKKFLFHSVYAVTGVFSGCLILYYIYILFLPNPVEFLSKVPNIRPAILADSVYIVNYHHLAMIVTLYAFLDASVLLANDIDIKRRFKTLLYVIDCPVVLSMIYISVFLVRPLGEHFHYFAAGVLSFQLVAGNLAVVVLEAWEIKIPAVGIPLINDYIPGQSDSARGSSLSVAEGFKPFVLKIWALCTPMEKDSNLNSPDSGDHTSGQAANTVRPRNSGKNRSKKGSARRKSK
jgi:hypothetical protein